MLPILLSLGPIKIYSYGVIFAIGLFFALYWWWKMGRDEHWDEISLFDSFFLTLLVFLIAGRAGYVLLHFAELGTLYRFLAILAFPGIDPIWGISASALFLWLYARAHDFDVWKVMDNFVVSLSLILIFGGIGGFLNGSNPGLPVSWGLMYPGQSMPRIPVDIWVILWSVVTFGIVSSVRKNFRFYSWYKAQASVVREGLASLVFIIAVGIYYVFAAWLRETSWRIGVFPISFLAGLVLSMGAISIIYLRVGKKDSSWSGRLQMLKVHLLQWMRHKRKE